MFVKLYSLYNKHYYKDTLFHILEEFNLKKGKKKG